MRVSFMGGSIIKKLCVKGLNITCDRISIDLIGFGKSEVELGEIGNEERVDKHNIKAIGVEEREEVKVVRSSRFDSEEGINWIEARDGTKERGKAMSVHGKMLMVWIRERVRDDARVEAMLRYINADESGHEGHSFRLDLIRQGASEPILRCDKSLKAQPTYDGLRGREQTPERALKLR